MEEVKRIVQLLIPHAFASFYAPIYISFSPFHSSCLVPPDPTIFSTFVKEQI